MNRPTKLAAAKTSAGLSLLFIVVYGSCNWITAHRSHVGTWYYSWEHFIPFVPLMIVPYMSIDLFFVAGPFLCQSREELRTLTRRIVFAILVAGACFLLVPLKLAVPRPQPGGWTGAIFNFLHGFDQPYNLFPSLHITLRTILASLYARHTHGAVRVASHVWFSLIGFSTVLTYQHHVVDVAGGFVLATFCFYLFREERARLGSGSIWWGEAPDEPGSHHRKTNLTHYPRLPLIPNYQIGGYYLTGAFALVALVPTLWPWTSILLWAVLSLGITGAAYWKLGPVIYRKTNGRLPLSARLLFAPNLIGQHLSLRHYRRRCDAWNAVTPNVWIGSRLNRREAREAKQRGVTAVLDLTAEFSEAPEFLERNYRNIPVLDLTGMSLSQLQEAADFISEQARLGIVYVHCKAGYSRSAAAVGAYLLASGKAGNVEEALALLRRARPPIVIRPEVIASLNDFATAQPRTSGSPQRLSA